MDFSPWNWASYFRLHEAACLIAGVMPVSKRVPASDELPAQARPILIALSSAYYEWFFQVKNPERPKAIFLKGILNPDGTLPKFPVLNVLAGEIVSRAAIHDFISEMGRKSAYDFRPIEEKKPSTPLEDQIFPLEQANTQTQAAPVVAHSASDGVELGKAGPAKPLQRTAAQDFAILCEIEKQGYDPLAVPKNPPGKPGAKAAIRTALSKNSLFTGGTVFDKAWERLTARADIVIQS